MALSEKARRRWAKTGYTALYSPALLLYGAYLPFDKFRSLHNANYQKIIDADTAQHPFTGLTPHQQIGLDSLAGYAYASFKVKGKGKVLKYKDFDIRTEFDETCEFGRMPVNNTENGKGMKPFLSDLMKDVFEKNTPLFSINLASEDQGGWGGLAMVGFRNKSNNEIYIAIPGLDFSNSKVRWSGVVGGARAQYDVANGQWQGALDCAQWAKAEYGQDPIFIGTSFSGQTVDVLAAAGFRAITLEGPAIQSHTVDQMRDFLQENGIHLTTKQVLQNLNTNVELRLMSQAPSTRNEAGGLRFKNLCMTNFKKPAVPNFGSWMVMGSKNHSITNYDEPLSKITPDKIYHVSETSGERLPCLQANNHGQEFKDHYDPNQNPVAGTVVQNFTKTYGVQSAKWVESPQKEGFGGDLFMGIVWTPAIVATALLCRKYLKAQKRNASPKQLTL